MDPSYESVVEARDMVFTLGAYLIHAVIVFLQAGLACFLLGTGLRSLLAPHDRVFGAVRILLGLLLLMPLLVGAPMGVSLLAGLAAVALLLLVGRRGEEPARPRARRVRRLAIAVAALVCLFMLWEGEDNLALGADLLLHAREWRNDELAWQLSQDPKSPKLGDLAPDFELQDPEGEVQVRLSDFRGVRPVALVFGSYT